MIPEGLEIDVETGAPWWAELIGFVALVLILGFLISGCGTRAPGDPFGWYRPEELVTICHDALPTEARQTMMFNRSKAKWHLKHHQFDRLGACAPFVLPST